MFKHLLVAVLFCTGLNNFTYAQQCGNCNFTPAIALYDVDVQVEPPVINGKDSSVWKEWVQLFWINKHFQASLFENNKNCIRFIQPADLRLQNEASESGGGSDVPQSNTLYSNTPPSGDLSKFGNYITTGFIKKNGESYIVHLEIQTSCTRKTVSSTDLTFQVSNSTQNSTKIGQQAAARFSPLIEKIKQFELRERQQNVKTALEATLADGITISPKKRKLAVGEQTELDIVLKDCDGFPLANREISFDKGSLNGHTISAGTFGGIVTPLLVTTDANGKAKANFRMSSDKAALINAYHLYNKPNGCESLKSGATTIIGEKENINQIPVKVELSFVQNETKTIKRATLPGIKIKGGNEIEEYVMFHNATLFYFPSDKELKDGYLVSAENDNDDPDATRYVVEDGYYEFTKTTTTAFIIGLAGNREFIQAKETGSVKKIEGYASMEHHSEVTFMKGNGTEPGVFSWVVQYPASPEGEIAHGSMMIVEGEEGVEWVVNKITDRASPYKTEYLLSIKLDAYKELKAGEKAMKELFGFDLDQMTGILDPTNPQSNMAGASGSQTLTVRILSPFPAN